MPTTRVQLSVSSVGGLRCVCVLTGSPTFRRLLSVRVDLRAGTTGSVKFGPHGHGHRVSQRDGRQCHPWRGQPGEQGAASNELAPHIQFYSASESRDRPAYAGDICCVQLTALDDIGRLAESGLGKGRRKQKVGSSASPKHVAIGLNRRVGSSLPSVPWGMHRGPGRPR